MIPAALLVTSAIVHFIFFGHPASVVFDEVHNGSYISSYWHGSYFFDVHPPLAKLIVAFFGYFTGASGLNVDFTAIGNALPFSVFILRLIPMVAGTILPLVIYAICRHLNLSKASSLLCGLIVIFENSLVVQSRFIMFDVIMLVFGFSAILFYLKYESLKTKGLDYSKIFLVLSAVLAASAFSVKWTGLSFAGFIIIMKFYGQCAILKIENIYEKIKSAVKKTIPIIGVYFIAIIMIYSGSFAIHFALLPNSGDGDLFMTPAFQKTLIGNGYTLDTTLPEYNFLDKFLELNLRMFIADQSLTVSHPYSSAWYTWPIMQRPIYYWEGINSNNLKTSYSYIYFIGNPIVYWLGAISIIALIIYSAWIFVSRKLLNKKMALDANDKKGIFFVITGYAINFLPLMFVSRVMFLYHYEAALIFSVVSIIVLLNMFSSFWKYLFGITIFGITLMIFLLFSPLTYGTPINNDGLSRIIWFSSWR